MKQVLNFLKAATGVVAKICVILASALAFVAAVFWPLFFLFPINIRIAIIIGVPYSLLAGFVIVTSLKHNRRQI